MKIYVIIVTYNGSKWIEKCLSSVFKTSIQVDVIIIDNLSTDNTVNIIEEKFSEVTLIKSEKNLGFGKANNLGIKLALEHAADYVFLLNQDAWIEKDTIEKLVEVNQKHPEFGILSPVPYDGEEMLLDFNYEKYYKNGIKYDIEFTNKTFEIGFINAAAWLMSLGLIQQLGGFHPMLIQRGEDRNYINRLHFHNNFKVGISMITKYYHDRQDRKTLKINQKKRLYNYKQKVKCHAFNPDRKPFWNWLKMDISMIINRKETKFYLSVLLFSLKMYFYSLCNRKIYYPLK